jgi:hypothetical protein
MRRGPSGNWGGHWRVRGWRRFWYERVVRSPVMFHLFAWLNCSVPGMRGRLGRLIRPPQAIHPTR